MTRYAWHVTCGGGEYSVKFQLPSFYSLGLKAIWRFGGKDWANESMNEWMTKVLTMPVIHRKIFCYSLLHLIIDLSPKEGGEYRGLGIVYKEKKKSVWRYCWDSYFSLLLTPFFQLTNYFWKVHQPHRFANVINPNEK